MPDTHRYKRFGIHFSRRTGRRRLFITFAAALLIGTIGAAGAQQPTEALTFELTLRGKKLTRPDNVVRVKKGDTVQLRWTTDRAVTIHLHGYDIEQSLSPDAVTTMSFEAHATGRFPVNLHDEHDQDHAHHGNGALLYLEVLPR